MHASYQYNLLTIRTILLFVK
uniref:Uncharacterized protein n=1 Tax=Anguilla anguilla TaxID=7936 RepID=A0A0E9UTB0_ANGAN